MSTLAERFWLDVAFDRDGYWTKQVFEIKGPKRLRGFADVGHDNGVRRSGNGWLRPPRYFGKVFLGYVGSGLRRPRVLVHEYLGPCADAATAVARLRRLCAGMAWRILAETLPGDPAPTEPAGPLTAAALRRQYARDAVRGRDGADIAAIDAVLAARRSPEHALKAAEIAAATGLCYRRVAYLLFHKRKHLVGKVCGRPGVGYWIEEDGDAA